MVKLTLIINILTQKESDIFSINKYFSIVAVEKINWFVKDEISNEVILVQ